MRVGIASFFKIAAFLIVLLLGLPLSSWAGVFWADPFEYATQGAFESVWDTSCPGNSSLMGPTTAVAMGPTHSLRSHMNDGVNSCYVNRSHTATKNVWMRWYLRVGPGFIFDGTQTTGSKQMYNKSDNGFLSFWHVFPGQRFLSVQIIAGNASNPVPVFCPGLGRVDDGCNYYANMNPVNFNDNQWYCVETHLNIGTTGTPTGSAEIFIDGRQTLGYYNIMVAGLPGSFTNITHYAQMGQGDRYIDDLAVGDTRIGCNGAAQPGAAQSGDNTPPSAPVGLFIH